MMAANWRHVKAGKLLLERGAQIDCRDLVSDGKSTLFNDMTVTMV